MAGNSAAANIEQFVYVAMNALYQATISFVSQNLGAGNYHRIRKIVIRAQLCVLAVGLILGNGVTILGNVLLGIYSRSDEVIQAGLIRLGICARTYALCGVMDVMVGGLRGIGYSVMPMIVSLIGACGLRLLWIATIFQIPRFHTIQMLYWSYPITWTITASVHIICFLWAMKRVAQPFHAGGRNPAGPCSAKHITDPFIYVNRRRTFVRRPVFDLFYSPSHSLTDSTAQAHSMSVTAPCPQARE